MKTKLLHPKKLQPALSAEERELGMGQARTRSSSRSNPARSVGTGRGLFTIA